LAGADMFIVSEDKMAWVKKFSDLLVVIHDKAHDVSFDIDVPHANSTLFAVQDTLCIVGGCDKDYEPFSDIRIPV